MNAELNEADAQFVANKVDAELKLDDITQTVKRVPVKGNGKKSKKPIELKTFLAQYAGKMEDLKHQARDLCYLERAIPEATYEGFVALLSRQRAARGSGIGSIPPQDPKERLAAARRRADEKALQKETVELELRGLRHEEKMCREARNSKDASAAAIAEITLQKLRERRIPDVEQALRKAKEAEDDALRDLRNERDIPKLGGLQHVARGSAER